MQSSHEINAVTEALDAPFLRREVDPMAFALTFVGETSAAGEWRLRRLHGPWRAVCGISPQELLADPQAFHELIAPDHRAAFMAASACPPFDIEIAMHHPQAGLRWRRIAVWPAEEATPEGGGAVSFWDGAVTDVTEARLVAEALLAAQDAVERQTLLIGELTHRAKNGVTNLMAMVSQTARGQTTVAGFQAQLMARLEAMATAQALVESTGEQVRLSDVMIKTLSPFDIGRFSVDAALDGVQIRGDLTVSMGLLLHELATNAVKYGALSMPPGRVNVEAVKTSGETVVFTWREVGGPLVRDIGRRGFGARLLEQVLRNRGGSVSFAFEPQGFYATVSYPATG